MFLRSSALLILFVFCSVCAQGQKLAQRYLHNQTYTHSELIDRYKKLANQHAHIKVDTFGTTDAGHALHVVKLANPKNSSQNPVKILVMNGIHPGESCGIDASLFWAEHLAENPEQLRNAEVYIIPIYNVGGSLNRSCCTRANQNGPDNQGFRGNAQNLDLNRDFLKADAKNTLSLYQLFQKIDPHVFVDTHSTNGADYQYGMTLIPFQHEKYPEPMQNISKLWYANIYNQTNKSVKTQHYVNVWGTTPRSGFSAFHVSSIYSSGYAGLMGAFAITSEAHMFKPYSERVEATQAVLQATLDVSKKMAEEMQAARNAYVNLHRPKYYATSWKLDSSVVKNIDFEGYADETYTSTLTGTKMYRYNREKPVTYKTDFYSTYRAVDSVRVPRYYALHQGQYRAIERLKKNGVELNQLKKDTILACSVNYVFDIEYATRPYEGHFPHRKFTLEERKIEEQFLAGDFIVSLENNKYFALEALEPSTPGSFFRWNFFDAFLQQKEGFSPYIFESMAAQFVDEHPAVKSKFEEKKKSDTAFRSSGFAQLYWIYQQMPYYEKEHNRIPVFKVY